MSGTLRLRGSTSGYSELQAPAVAADQTFVLPTAGGTLLTTDSPVPKLTLELGSASQPSLTFQGDTDTGLFSEGTNTLNLVTGGSSKVVLGAAAHTIYAGTGATVRAIDIDSAGNVGIGTTNPDTKLQIGDNTVNVNNVIKLGKRVTCTQTNLPLIGHTSVDGADSSLALCATSGGGHILFYTGNDDSGFGAGSNDERMRIDSSGRLGVGTSSPSNKLHVEANNSSADLVYFNNTGVTASDVLRLNTAGTGSGTNIFDAQAGGTSRFLVKGDGNVGIGTDSPQRKLEIAGSGGANFVELRLNATDGGERQITFVGSGSNTHTIKSTGTSSNSLAFIQGSTERLRIDSSGNLTAYSGSTNGNYFVIRGKHSPGDDYNRSEVRFGVENNANGLGFLAFATGNNTAYERLRIDSSGNVGIGTSSPTDKLSIHTAPNSLVIGAKDTTRGNHVFQLLANNTAGDGEFRLYKNAASGTHGKTVEIKSTGVSYFNGGNVGIGTTNPDAKITIVAESGVPTLHLSGSPNVGDTTDIALSVNSVIRGETSIRNVINDNGYFSWSIGGTNNLAGTSGSTERMRIDSAGNVGIGDNDPDTKLSIKKPIDAATYGSGTRMIDFKSYFPGYDLSLIHI